MKKDLSELNALLTEVDDRRLMSDVDAICTGERLSNAAEKASFEFLAKAFAKAGCEVAMEWLPGYVSTPEKAALRVNGEAFPCLTHPMTPSAAVEGRLRYVAAGHDAEANDLADSIVLTEGLAMEPRVRAFEARGARGVIFITGRFTHNMIVSRVWGSPTPETRHDYVGIPVASTSLSTGNSLKTLAKENACARLATEVHSRWTTIPALTATLPGVSDDFVMVTGHNDSWGLGALDNASGNACELELARLMASVPREKRLLTIRFVIWGGHSHGRYAGSSAYLDAHFMELAQHGLLNINTDCLGGRGATVLTQSPAMACTADLARFALKAGASVEDWEGTRFNRSCDQSFWGCGVPSLFSQVSEQPPATGAAADAFKILFGGGKSGGFGWWWHTTEDTPDKLDSQNLQRDVRVFLAALWQSVTTKTWPVDLLAEAWEVEKEIIRWQEKAGAALDLSPTLEACKAAEASLARLVTPEDFPARLSDDRVRRALKLASRTFVALGYVEKALWEPDPAVATCPMPMLRAIDKLASADDFTRQCLLVKLRRQANRMTLMLSDLQDALEAACG